MKFDLGAGLFSDESKALMNGIHIQYIPLDKLDTNDDKHGYSLDDIDELAASISDIGLQQNLVVEDNGDGSYSILTGRRRFYAMRKLRDEGDERFKSAPCVVQRLSDIDLPISDEVKRIYAIATTNAEQRKLTKEDRAQLVKQLSTVYEELKKAGAKPKGGRRNFIAESVGVSPRTVTNIEAESEGGEEQVSEPEEETEQYRQFYTGSLRPEFDLDSLEEAYTVSKTDSRKIMKLLLIIQKKYAEIFEILGVE